MNNENITGDKAIDLAVAMMYCMANMSIDDTIKGVHEMVTRVSTSPLGNEIFRLNIARTILQTKKCANNAKDIKRMADELRDIAKALDEKAKEE